MHEMTKRKNWIDAVKAIAIMVVALNHSELVIPGVNFWGGMFFVPVFFVISGYTYHMSYEKYSDFFAKKTKRLLVPYFCTNLLLFFFFVIKRFLTNDLSASYLKESVIGIFYGRNQIFTDAKNPIYLMQNLNAPMWFLPALFVALCILEGMYRIFDGNEKKVWIGILLYTVVATAYHYFVPVLLPWCLDIMPYFLLMMMAGKKLRDAEILEVSDVSNKKKIAFVIGLFAILMASALINGSVNLSISYLGKSVTLMCLASISSSVLLMMAMYLLEQKWTGVCAFIGKLGKHTLTILCGHYFFLGMINQVFRSVISNMMLSMMRAKTLNAAAEDAFRTVWIPVSKILAMVLSIAICVAIDLLIIKVKQRKEKERFV